MKTVDLLTRFGNYLLSNERKKSVRPRGRNNRNLVHDSDFDRWAAIEGIDLSKLN